MSLAWLQFYFKEEAHTNLPGRGERSARNKRFKGLVTDPLLKNLAKAFS